MKKALLFVLLLAVGQLGFSVDWATVKWYSTPSQIRKQLGTPLRELEGTLHYPGLTIGGQSFEEQQFVFRDMMLHSIYLGSDKVEIDPILETLIETYGRPALIGQPTDGMPRSYVWHPKNYWVTLTKIVTSDAREIVFVGYHPEDTDDGLVDSVRHPDGLF